MIGGSFQTGDLVHLTTLGVCASIVSMMLVIRRRFPESSDRQKLRRFVGWGCIAVWILNTSYWMMPERFTPESSFPLHFCNVANIFGWLAVVRGIRLFQGVIYFWSGLYVWAFLTPTVGSGPPALGFWVFWIYHFFIAFAFVHTFAIDRFRPSFRDLLLSSGFTLCYVIFLAIIDALTGWNYGFLGDEVPGAPTPVDLLGPYPLRLLWMVLIGAAVFLVLWLPFCRRTPQSHHRPPEAS